MGLLNPVVSKFVLSAGVAQEVYFCPVSKSHAVVDLSFFKDNLSTGSLIEIALSTKTSAALLDSVDFFIDDIELIGTVNSAELNKVVVGAGERLYVRVLTGPDIVVRLSGVEETNTMVLNAGRLAAMSVPGTSQAVVYNNNMPNTAYASCSVTIYNSSTASSAEIEGWITNQETPSSLDKVIRVTIPNEDTTIIENILIAPNEKIVFKSSQANTEYFVNGIVISSGPVQP